MMDSETPPLPPTSTDRGDAARSRPFAYLGEKAIEWTIRVCGWSAIFFVLAIFFFVFREAAPLIFSSRGAALVTSLGPSNDLVFRALKDRKKVERSSAEDGREVPGANRVLFRPVPKGDVAFDYDLEAKKLTVDYVPGVTTARDIVYAMAEDAASVYFTVYPDPDEAPPEGSPKGSINDGSGLFAPEQDEVVMTPKATLDFVEFFTSSNWRPTSETRPQYGALALIVGSVSVTGLAMLIAVPFGLGAAVYVSEFCSGKAKEVLKIVIELLAVIPSVVWGFIGLMVLGPLIMKVTGAPAGLCLLNGAIILSLMAVPIIVSIGEDALKAVPDSYREAALSLGSDRWEIVYRVLFPAAKNGLLAAVLLGVGRAVGETMAMLMATGHAAQIPHSLLDPVRTLTATIAAELGDTVHGGDHYRVLFVLGVLLFAITFVINLIADLVIKGIRSDKRS